MRQNLRPMDNPGRFPVFARGRGIRLLNSRKLVQLPWLHPDARVGDRERNHAIVAPLHLQGDPAILGEFAGIAEQVEKRLSQLGQVGAHGSGRFRKTQLERVVVLCHERLNRPRDIPHRLRDVHRLEENRHPPGLDLREVEDVVDQLQQCRAEERIFPRSPCIHFSPVSSASSSSISL